MDLANALVYKGQLEAGSAAVGAAQLVLPQAAALHQVGFCSFRHAAALNLCLKALLVQS
jgi:hypothetical protein